MNTENRHKYSYVIFILLFMTGFMISQGKVCGEVKDTKQTLKESSLTNVSYKLPVDSAEYFRIKVVDKETSRGIPLVAMTMLSGVDYYTDSAGVVAFYEAGLMNRKVFFYVKSHGYEFQKDGFGIAGKTLDVVPGGSAVIKMKRINIAQRLYRITGSGIYYHSVMLGEKTPISFPIIQDGVLGQDSTLVTIYKEKLFWVWGDTTHPRYPLAANFKATCATSLLPEQGGLDPEVGVEYDYFTDGDFVKKMVPLPGSNPYWLGSLLSVKDDEGEEHLLAHYSKIKPPLEAIERGMVKFNDSQEIFQPIALYQFDEVIKPNGHPFRVEENGKEYFYFFSGGLVRTRTEYDSVVNHSYYEALTCLKEGSRFDNTAEQIIRDNEGTLQYSWKRNTTPIGADEEKKLVEAGLIKPEERWFQLFDISSGNEIIFHGGSIYWNPYRERWVMVALQIFGTSLLGEVWYAEGDTPLGPWVYAQKIVTHDDYSFYNPVQHPHFTKDDGRIIFFEGTYTKSFSGSEIPTPRYDYNQIMYKLELDDSRLFLPVPVYEVHDSGTRYVTKQQIPEHVKEPKIAFYAPDRHRKGTVPVYGTIHESGDIILTAGVGQEVSPARDKIVFYAVSPSEKNPPTTTIPLYVFKNSDTHNRFYSTDISAKNEKFQRGKEPVCYVWEKKTHFNPYKVKSLD